MSRWSSVVLLVLVGLGACGAPQPRVIVLGIDGLDPATIDLMMAEGQLPSFARLRTDGSYGLLRAAPPLLSPVLWTTIATGKGPTEHGIGHFVAVKRSDGAELPVTSAMRKVKAVWNIASEAGLETATVGWWATWPPEKVNGVVVSDHTCYHFLFPEGQTGGAGTGVTYPPDLQGSIAHLIRRPGDVGIEEASRYIDVAAEEFDRSFDFSNDVSHFRWALATAASYTDVGLDLWQKNHPDLLMVYIEGTDSISHLFGHLFRADGLVGDLAEQQRRYGRAVEEVYRYADEIVGRFLEVMDDETTLLVMSDHGFKLGELLDDPTMTRDIRRVSERDHREHGILYMYGNNVRRQARINGAVQIDVTPTILTLLGLEPALDMSGRVLAEALDLEIPAREIATYEDGASGQSATAQDGVVNDQIRAHLESLGYLEGATDSPSGDRTLAALHFEAGRYEEAAEMYSRFIQENPDDEALHASLSGCLGAMGRYEEALKALNRELELNPISVEAHHNRAVIHERLGDIDAAVADYRTALRYMPDYEPSIRALVRLTGSADVRAPQSRAEAQAADLAQQASELARRAAYGEAMALLDRAASLAPAYVVVYQYQANVAFLMGDYNKAEAALERAIELEPDNALFRRNLADVRRKQDQP